MALVPARTDLDFAASAEKCQLHYLDGGFHIDCL